MVGWMDDRQINSRIESWMDDGGMMEGLMDDS